MAFMHWLYYVLVGGAVVVVLNVLIVCFVVASRESGVSASDAGLDAMT